MKLIVAKPSSSSFLISSLKNFEDISLVLVILIIIQASGQEIKFDSKIVTLKYGKVQGRLVSLSAQPHLHPVNVFLGNSFIYYFVKALYWSVSTGYRISNEHIY